MVEQDDLTKCKLNDMEKDLNGINGRINNNEKDINIISTKQQVFEVKFESLVDNLAEMPHTVSQMKEAILLIQNENKNIMVLIQNENRNIINRLEILEKKSDENDNSLKLYVQEEIKKTNNEVTKINTKVEEINEDGKFNIRKFIKDKWILILAGGGFLLYFSEQIINVLVK